MHWKNLTLLALLIALAAILTGCAGTARGQKGSVYQYDRSVSAIDTSRSSADAMIVIRYPAVVAEDAQAAYYRAFEQNAIGGSVKVNGAVRNDTDRMAQALIAKSNYYAMSLFRELQAMLPDDTVLLSPHMIAVDSRHQLTSRPLLASEEVPSVLTIDFNVYSFPDPREMMNSEPLTFGDIVTPLFVVHANRWLRPTTHGLLLSSDPLLPSAWNQSHEQAVTQVENRNQDELFSYYRPLDFVTFLAEGPQSDAGIPTRSAATRGDEIGAVETHPLEKIQMDGQTISRLGIDHQVDPFAADFVKGAASRVVRALNQVDHDRATFFTRQIALTRFDPSLGEAVLSRSRSEAIRARLQMAEALLEAERKFLASQSRSLYEGTYEGTYGDQMRQLLVGEHRLLEERRSLARQQNMSTAIAVLALAAGAYAGSNTNSSNFFHSRTMYNIAMMGSLWAANSAISANAESKTMGENFLAQMAPAINRQVSVQLEWLESREEITASDFSEFRNQTLSLYQRSVRATDHVFDPECSFSHPETATQGRWFGLCRNGKGFSDGYGLILEEDGSMIEYVGSAQDGLASGAGAMIIDTPGESGAVYYEGSFREGLPDGVVLLEKPGRKPKVRTFRAGSDSGSADADQLQRVLF